MASIIAAIVSRGFKFSSDMTKSLAPRSLVALKGGKYETSNYCISYIVNNGVW
jgi:hypothetical protein